MGMRRPDLALTSMAVFLVGAMLVTVLVFPDRAKPAKGIRFNLRELTIGTFAVDPRQHSDFMWLMASRLLILVSANGLQKFAVFYFKDVFYPGPGARLEGLASLAARDLQGIILVVALAATFPAAELSHRIGRRPFIVASGLLGAAGTVGLVFSSSHLIPDVLTHPVATLLGVPDTLSQALYFGILVGVGMGIFLAVDWAYMVDVIPVEESGRFLGFSNIATASSGVVAGFPGGPPARYLQPPGIAAGPAGWLPRDLRLLRDLLHPPAVSSSSRSGGPGRAPGARRRSSAPTSNRRMETAGGPNLRASVPTIPRHNNRYARTATGDARPGDRDRRSYESVDTRSLPERL